MTDAERKLLIWCGIMLVRDTPLTTQESDEIDQLIADVRSPLPGIEWYCSFCGRSEAEFRHRPVAGPGNVRICLECCHLAIAAMAQSDRLEGRDIMSWEEFKARNPRQSGK
jgi:hypothetical protein